ncbi:alpha/beta fold hydrolase [Peptoniphilus equinus]|uniref:Alpha/beta fold hydrolase n=1 Tax=Peptoniphilus equinus TaxID=3016343 RepID=A0ABY7QU28_9FIRM|nr:alpha/beta fold hydrolase [Peptoniphilus equinus]WBW49961.1 alpha/beta fold hydrolase [Peptoniphilus equinus]
MMEHIYYPSSNGEDTVHGILWPVEHPRYCVQIIHGMQEHIGRYHDLAKFLNKHGVYVAGEDHLGHGHTARDKAHLGDFGRGDTVTYVLKDIRTLHNRLRALDVPVYFLGHSMGSFILRYYLSMTKVDRAVIMGTGNTPSSLASLLVFLARMDGRLHGSSHRSAFLQKLTTGNLITHADEGSWLSYNEANVKAYYADPLNAQAFAPSGYIFLGKLLDAIAKPQCYTQTKGSELLLISGADDPLNANDAVKHVYDNYLKAGVTAEMVLMAHMRHEVLNEDGREEVKKRLLHFFDEGVRTSTESL